MRKIGFFRPQPLFLSGIFGLLAACQQAPQTVPPAASPQQQALTAGPSDMNSDGPTADGGAAPDQAASSPPDGGAPDQAAPSPPDGGTPDLP